MTYLRSPLRILATLAIAAGLMWGSGMVASGLAQSERLHAGAHSVRTLDYATDAVEPGSRFSTSRPTWDQ